MRRGEIWWAALGQPFGSAPGYRRPVLVLQIDDFNESTIHTVVVAAVTSNTKLAAAPGNVLCSRRDTRLSKSLGCQRLASGDDRQAGSPRTGWRSGGREVQTSRGRRAARPRSLNASAGISSALIFS